MILLEDQPALTDLHNLITKVPKYPISVKQLIELAVQQHSAKPVVDFYKTFPEDEIFSDKDDLLARTEHIEMLHHETAPEEEMHAPEDD